MEFVLVAFGHQNELSIRYGSCNPLNGHCSGFDVVCMAGFGP